MIHPKLLMATAIIVSLVSTACSDMTAPKQLVQESVSLESSRRSGTLHVEKDCSAYTGHAGDFCTITSSSLEQIKVGSRVVYARDAVGASLDTDVILYAPGRGNNRAFGHCALSLATGIGWCEFSGGTGKFTGFRARVAVSYLAGPNYAWDGRYSFTSNSHGQDGDDR